MEIIIQAVDVQTAIEKGLKKLGVTKEEVEVQVLEEESSRFFGLIKNPAEVHLRLKKSEPEVSSMESQLNLLDEDNQEQAPAELSTESKLIKIEADGTISLNKDIKSRYPVIKGDQKVNIYLNEQLSEQEIIVTPDKQLRVETIAQQARTEIKIRISEDKLEAYLKVEMQAGEILKPKVVELAEEEGDLLIIGEKIEELRATKPSLADLKAELKEQGISYGIQEEALREALENPNREYLVAQGKIPVQSVDGSIEYLFEQEEEISITKEQQRVDHFSLNQIKVIKKGEVLAIKNPPQSGEAGYDVFGDLLEVREPKDVEWKLGEGVELVANRVIALRAGEPALKNGALTVRLTYTVPGDVDASQGNVDFYANVVVKKNVHENFKVKAGGRIDVYGNVAHAYLEANDGIMVKGNVVGSELSVGKLATYYQNSYLYLKQLDELLTSMESAIAQLKAHNSFKMQDLKKYGDRRVIQLLLDTKYTRIPEILGEFYQISQKLNKEEANRDLIKLLELSKNKINKNGFSNIENMEEFLDFKNRINSVARLISKFGTETGDIKVAYVQNSNLEANGKIMVGGKGAYNSSLSAGEKVVVQGVFRGGEIRALEDVYIKELGSLGGSQVKVSVPEDKRIKAEKVYANVLVNIGQLKYRFQKDCSMVSASLDNEGNISIF